MTRITKEQAYARGREAAKVRFYSNDFIADIEGFFPQWRVEFPLSAHLDYRTEIVKLWRERIDADLDLTKYPECKGLREIVKSEYQGYLDSSGGNEVQAAYYYNYYYYLRMRLQTRYFGFMPEQMGKPTRYGVTADACTAIWFEDSPDGPLNGKNLDTSPNERKETCIPQHIPYGEPIKGVRLMGTASAPGLLYDEEPEDIFPVNIDDIYPDDIRAVKDYVAFRYRYRQFSNLGNAIYVDEEGNSVAIEHSNCRMGWRFPTNGISVVTASAFSTPEMRQFKLERDRLSLEKRGWTEDCPDWVYWRGCDERYMRLLKLVEEEGKRGPTLEGMARMLLDPEGPIPERISIANEEFWPGLNADFWTTCTWTAVVFGPERRTYRWSQPLNPTGPIFKLNPELHLGERVAMQDKFTTELACMTAIGKG